MWFEKGRMNWDIPSDEELVRRLQPPKGKVDMVLDTDTYNEVDDQFALSYALLSPEKLNVQAIYAAPFYNDRSGGPRRRVRCWAPTISRPLRPPRPRRAVSLN